MTYDKKSISPLITFLCWCILMLLVCFVGLSNVFAYEIVDFKLFQRNQFPASTWFDLLATLMLPNILISMVLKVFLDMFLFLLVLLVI